MKNLVKKLISLLPLELGVKIKCFYHLRYWLNLESPRTFNEKINWRMLYEVNDLFSLCSDKYGVRDYVRCKLGEEYLIPLLFKGKSLTADRLKGLGSGVVVKCTHDSGNVSIIDGEVDMKYLESICQQKNDSLELDFGKKTNESWYSRIEPQIVVEKLLVKKDGKLPEDYKFHVFNCSEGGRVILQVDYDRFEGHNRSFYDEDLNLLPFGIKYKNKRRKIKEQPKNYGKMLKAAKTLSGDFDYVRVDLYNVDGEVFFGELTFAHGAGQECFLPKAYDEVMGGYWKISQ